MSLWRNLVALSVPVLMGPVSFAAGPVPTADSEKVAQRLVTSAGAREGDLVLISGSVRDAELLEQLAVYVRAAGAHPIVSLDSERMYRQMFAKVPARYDSQAPAFGMKLADVINAQIIVQFGENPAAFADVPPARRMAVAKAGEPIGKTIYARGVRQVYLGNDLYPTKSNSEIYGIPQADLAKMFWDAVSLDPAKLQSTGDALRSALGAAKEVQVRHPNGTSLRMRVEGRPVYVSDGVISREEEKKGGAACSVWLPAGEVYVTPVAASAEGTVVVDRQVFEGKEIQGLTLTYKAGKLTSMTAKSGLEPLKALYDAAGEGKDLFGVIDFGINPAIRTPAGSRVLNFVPAGMVTLVLGNNLWAGGDNSASFNLASFLPGTTVTVDGKAVVENGALKF